MMRDQDSWELKALPKILKQLPPRIRQDLSKRLEPIPLPDQGTSQFIWGPSGTGKTILAAQFYLEACRLRFLNGTNERIAFISTPELFNQLKRSYSDPDRDEQHILEHYSTVDILILDDFGAERPTEWVLTNLYLIVNRRYENLLTTIFTSNFDLEGLAKHFGDDRVSSRINRMIGDPLELKTQRA